MPAAASARAFRHASPDKVVEQEVGPGRPLAQVDQEVLEPPQAPGGLEQLPAEVRQVAARGQAPRVQGFNLNGELAGVRQWGDLGKRERLEVVEGPGARQRVGLPTVVRPVLPARVRGHLGARAEPRVGLERLGRTAEFLLVRGHREAHEPDVDDIVEPPSAAARPSITTW